MKSIVRFMSSTAGRVLRVIAGIGVIAWAFTALGGRDATIVALIGGIPILTGLLDICVLGPVTGQALKGRTVRAVHD